MPPAYSATPYQFRDRNSCRASDIVICPALMNQSRTFCSVLYHWVSYVENPSVKTRLVYHIAYYKSIIKSPETYIQRTTKREHTRCRQLPLFTFTLNSGDNWSSYLSEVFLRILAGKKHRLIKLQRLQKVQIWAFGLLVQ